jgi:hypothetical protein
VSDLERELRAEIAALRGIVEELRAQVFELDVLVVPTMKKTLRCPACGETRIAYVEKPFAAREWGMALGVVTSTFSAKQVGELEAFACAACGFVEWHVKDPNALCDVDNKFSKLTIVDGQTDAAGPYR